MPEYSPSRQPHNTDNLVITCLDHRFQRAYRTILSEKGIDIDFVDRLAIGGSSKGVADGTLMPSIEVSYKLHEIKNVHVFDHLDCGAFGGLEAFGGNEEQETAEHISSLDASTAKIKGVLPHLIVIEYIVGLDGRVVEVDK